ncbi:MAG: type VI secretion system baseplate subunit TssF [Acidobacteria bacterium]|nr:type VI secretion system baseplate subunit TssF [Acidobacteriota bacterium]
MAARISLKLEDELPETTESFINVIYPHYLAPIPSMAITQFSFGSPNDKLTAVQKPSNGGARLNSRPVDGTPPVSTGFDVALFRWRYSGALESLAPKDGRGRFSEASIRLSMRCYGNANLHEMSGRRHRRAAKVAGCFYINGDPQLIFRSTNCCSTIDVGRVQSARHADQQQIAENAVKYSALTSGSDRFAGCRRDQTGRI